MYTRHTHSGASRRHTRALPLCALALAAIALGSCDRIIYDYEGDCSVNYKVKFVYDYNMKYADAFAHEVENVTLYIADRDGNIVWSKTESGDTLATGNYEMTLDGLAPGTYDLLAWCGAGDNGSFTVPASSTIDGLTCSLSPDGTDPDLGAYTDGEIDNLWHGYLENQEFGSTEGTYVYEMPLVKDTNHILVALQQISGGEIDKDEFTYAVLADNANLDWDNSILGDDQITYWAWYTEQGEGEFDMSGVYKHTGTTDEDEDSDADTDTDTDTDTDAEAGTSSYGSADSGTEGFFANEAYGYRMIAQGPNTAETGTRGTATFSAAIAEFTVNRLVLDHEVRLEVTNKESGELVFSFPLLDIAYMFEGYYNTRTMTRQEFLDRQDDYTIVVFLDGGNRWVTAYINILSWHVVIQNTSL